MSSLIDVCVDHQNLFSKNSEIRSWGADPLLPIHALTLSTVYLMTYKSFYRQTSNISHTLVGNKLFDHLDVVGASAVGAAPTTPSFST